MEVIITRKIVPSTLIFKKQCKKIIEYDDKFVIKEYRLHFSKDDKLKKVTIRRGFHPNCDPQSGELCLPQTLQMKEADLSIIPHIETLLGTFNLDDCYYQPWSEFCYEGGRV